MSISKVTGRLLRIAFSLLVVGILGLPGCGPNDGRVEVKGVVLLDGEPLPQANIAFVGEDGGAFATASTDAQGRFTLRAARGLNKVSVAKFDTEGAEEWAATSDEEEEELLAGTPEEMAEGNANQPQPVIAQKYFNADTSGIQFDVQPGMGEVTIEVTKE